MKSRKPNPKAIVAGTSRRGSKDSPEFPGVKSYKDRHGKTRWRVRDADDNTVNLGTDYGSPEFIRRYTAAMGLQAGGTDGRIFQVSSVAAPANADGTHSLSTLIDNWYQSAQFRGLGPTTAYTYTKIAERLRAALGDAPVETLSRAVVKQIMQSCADRPGAANNFLRILRLMLDHAMETLEWIDYNPAKEVKKFSPQRPGGFHTWSEREIEKFYARWDFGTAADLVMSVMLFTGASRADAVRLGPANLSRSEGGELRLSYRRQKMMTRGGAVVDIPVHPELARRLADLPEGQTTFLQTANRNARSPNGIGNSMRGWCDAAGLPQCTSHGLRKACARRLAEAGATPHEIMAVTGHKTLAEVTHYTEEVERRGLADSAFIANPI